MLLTPETIFLKYVWRLSSSLPMVMHDLQCQHLVSLLWVLWPSIGQKFGNGTAGLHSTSRILSMSILVISKVHKRHTENINYLLVCPPLCLSLQQNKIQFNILSNIQCTNKCAMQKQNIGLRTSCRHNVQHCTYHIKQHQQLSCKTEGGSQLSHISSASTEAKCQTYTC